MKKYILLFSILLISCNAPVEDPQGSGYWAGGDGTEKFINASDELTETYSKWVEAHNNKDIDAILSFQTDSIRIALANGDYISFINSEDYKSYIAFREMYNSSLLHHKDVVFSLI